MKIVYLYTDFSYDGPYVGEMKAVVNRQIKNVACIDLMHDAPKFNPRASAYILTALSRQFRAGDSCLAIIDPEVGSEHRRPILIVADDIVYCGPDNGLFGVIIQTAKKITCYEITGKPKSIAITFHGRDLFAPAMAKFLNKNKDDIFEINKTSLFGYDWPDDLDEIIYFDGYGNAVSGRRANTVARNTCVVINGVEIKYASTFSENKINEPFWYMNSMGLVEIAVNQGSARKQLRLEIGQLLTVVI